MSSQTSKAPGKERPKSGIPSLAPGSQLPLKPSAPANLPKHPTRSPGKKTLSKTSASSTQISTSPRKSAQPVAPRPDRFGARKPSKLAIPRSSTARESSGLLTPRSTTQSDSSGGVSDSPTRASTPPVPKKDISRVGTEVQPSSPHGPLSPYVKAHVADPCIRGALVHKLACGHKVITEKPEKCGANCCRPLPRQVQKHANRMSEETFVCSACVEVHVQRHRDMKRALFDEMYQYTERQMVAFPERWLNSKRDYWERVWENDVQKERMEFASLGRSCCHFLDVYVPLQTNRETAVATAVPWPPRRRPRKPRGSGLISESLVTPEVVSESKRDSRRDSKSSSFEL